MTILIQNNKCRTFSKESVYDVLTTATSDSTTLSAGRLILLSGGNNKLIHVPFLCSMVSENTFHTFNEVAEIFVRKLSLNNIETILAHIRPDIKSRIDKEFAADPSYIEERDYSLVNFIDNNFDIEHPRDKIAYLYYIAQKGGIFTQLAGGCRMVAMDDDPEFLFDMPYMALQILRQGLHKLNDQGVQTTSKNDIMTKMPSLILEAYIKFIHTSLLCGGTIGEVASEISWIVENYQQSPKWHRLIEHHAVLQKIFCESASDDF